MQYISDHMTKALADHVLEEKSETHYLMRRPRTRIYHIHIAEVGNHIVLTGDLNIGKGAGIVSVGGYRLDWFSKPLSPDYLAEKFLREKWEWERAKQDINYYLANPDDYGLDIDKIEALTELISPAHTWPYDEPNAIHFGEALYDIDPYLVDDGTPGYGWPINATGWLSAVNQRFAALMAERSELAPTG